MESRLRMLIVLAGLPEPVPFIDGALVPLRGMPHRVVSRPAGRGRPAIRSESARITAR